VCTPRIQTRTRTNDSGTQLNIECHTLAVTAMNTSGSNSTEINRPHPRMEIISVPPSRDKRRLESVFGVKRTVIRLCLTA
jgi:hypothetical protein